MRLEMCGLRHCGNGAAAQECLCLRCRSAGLIVPAGEVSYVLGAYIGRRRPMVGLGAAPKCVPGEVDGALNGLSPHIREPTACFDDRADQARSDHRTTSHLIDVGNAHGLGPSIVILIGEPAVLQPAGTDQVSGLIEDVGEMMELGEPCAGIVTITQLSGEVALAHQRG